jgi:carotenoid cleavage dioxygenase-like enzyme
MSTTWSFTQQGNYLPVHDELTADDLRVTGAIPPELSGWFLRNGPNSRSENKHWLTGDGMLHGVRLEHGRAAWYRNRWVRTSSFTDHAQLYRPDGSRNLTAGVANTHIVNHAGRTLALYEVSLPYEVTCDLDTVGPYDFDGRLQNSMTAHPKICPATGELHFFGYGSLTPPYVTYHRANAHGKLIANQPIDVGKPTMMHDFALTAEHVIFMDLPVVFDLATAMSESDMPFRWDEAYGARLGVLRRDDPTGGTRWFPVQPCYVWHVLNAHDTGDGRIVLHVVRYPHLWWEGHADVAGGMLWRWTLDLTTGAVREEQIDDTPGEFPRIDDRLAGLDCRYGHVTDARDPDEAHSALRRYDLHTATVENHTFTQGRVPGEAVFVPASQTVGGDGWLLTYVYDARTHTSDLVILDTTNLTGPPVAAVHLPQRVPEGFHGNWIPEA